MVIETDIKHFAAKVAVAAILHIYFRNQNDTALGRTAFLNELISAFRRAFHKSNYSVNRTHKIPLADDTKENYFVATKTTSRKIFLSQPILITPHHSKAHPFEKKSTSSCPQLLCLIRQMAICTFNEKQRTRLVPGVDVGTQQDARINDRLRPYVHARD